MIFVTGDTHGYFTEIELRARSAGLGKGDILLICGDFGFVWGDGEHESYLTELSWKPYTIAFIDGNHENFDLLESYPVERWNGGRVHRIKPNIVHLIRGEIFDIEGHSFFAFGGACSMDRYRRREGIDWWAQELPGPRDYANARVNLERVGYRVDYVLTHTLPKSFIPRLGVIPDPHDAELTGYLDWLYDELSFERWFAGHFHEDVDMDDIRVLLRRMIEIK